MSKPIKDYTLGEVEEQCRKIRHSKPDKFCEESGCDFFQRGICSGGWVHNWDLSEPPRWTQEEVERAKALKVIWPEATMVSRAENTICIQVDKAYKPQTLILFADRFPSLNPGETVKLEEIINAKTD